MIINPSATNSIQIYNPYSSSIIPIQSSIFTLYVVMAASACAQLLAMVHNNSLHILDKTHHDLKEVVMNQFHLT